MILTGSEIKKNVEQRKIIIEPFYEEQINPNSYNYRLGETYIELHDKQIVDLRKNQAEYKERKLAEEGTVFYPNHVYLCNTYERIGSYEYVTLLIGKSSMGRLGLFIQLSADLGHQGEIHKWTLEVKPSIPIIVYPHMIIGQVTFWKTVGERQESGGYYCNYDDPTESRGINNDFDR